MPYQLQGPPPITSPFFFEPPVPYPHWYRYGPDYSRAMFRSESSEGAWVRNPTTVLSGLGYTSPHEGHVPDAACWDVPSFKPCQKSCYDRANLQTTDEDKARVLDTCFWDECVTPCEAGLAKSGGGASSATSWLTSLSPKTLALGAVGVAVVLAVIKRKKMTRRPGRR